MKQNGEGKKKHRLPLQAMKRMAKHLIQKALSFNLSPENS